MKTHFHDEFQDGFDTREFRDRDRRRPRERERDYDRREWKRIDYQQADDEEEEAREPR